MNMQVHDQRNDMIIVFFISIANLDEGACRQPMLDHVAENCCYGAKPAEEMTITHHHGLTAFHVSCNFNHNVNSYLLNFG